MSYDLHIFNNETPNPMGDEVDEYAPLGSRKHVVDVIDSFFPEMTWLSAFQGECNLEKGLVEFSISGDPVEAVRVFLHGADAVPMLARMSQQNGWWIFDDSSGEAIVPPNQGDQGDSQPLQTKMKDGQSRSIARLPKIKKRLRGDDARYRQTGEGVSRFIIRLAEGETAFDLWHDHTRFLDTTGLRVHNWACSGIIDNSELVTPSGERFAELIFMRSSAETRESVNLFCIQTGRESGTILATQAILPDGSPIPLCECEIYFRSRPRKAPSD